MLGIADENVLERGRGEHRERRAAERDGCRVYYNQTNPTVIEDGIGSVTVLPDDGATYVVNYSGFRVGWLLVTEEGIDELSDHLFGGDDPIPNWLLDAETVDADDRPWWIPDGLALNPTMVCARCQERKDVETMVSAPPVPEDGRYCRECWEEARHVP